MALYITIEDAQKLWKEEHAKIHHSLQLFNEIIESATSQPSSSPGFLVESTPPTDTPPVDEEEMGLLERALEKALRVGSGVEPFTRPSAVKLPSTQNEPSAASKDSMKSSKGKTKNKLMSKTIERKDQTTYQAAFHRSPSTKPADAPKHNISKSVTHQNANSDQLPGLQDHGQYKLCGSNKTIVKSQLSGKNSKSVTDSFRSNSTSMESGGNCLIQQELLTWTHLKCKENRWWDKILVLERKSSVCGRDKFMTRMRATFPIRWPCGSPEQIQALVYRLSLADNRQMDDLLASQTLQDDKKRDRRDINNSKLKFERLKMIPQDIHKCAAQVRKEWESWDRWRPEWGCLCPTRADDERHEERTAPLPMTVTYATEKELTELETLRMRVALLQQELCQEMTLTDTLSPHISSVVQKPFHASLLRDFYSVLGKGGELFPAIVLDSEPAS